MYTIFWYHLGATNALQTEEFDTVIDFLDLIKSDTESVAHTTILYKDHSYSVEAFLKHFMRWQQEEVI